MDGGGGHQVMFVVSPIHAADSYGLAIQRSRPSVDYDGDDCDGEYCIGGDDNREDEWQFTTIPTPDIMSIKYLFIVIDILADTVR